MSEHRHTLRLPVLMPSPVYCTECVRRLRQSVERLPGVSFTELDPGAAALTVVHDVEVIGDDDLERTVRALGLEVSAALGHASYRVTGLDCPDCAGSVDKSISYIDGVVTAELNFATSLLLIEYDLARDPRAEVVATVRRMGYGVESVREARRAGAVAEFRVRNVDCPSCAMKLEDIVSGMAGVESAGLDVNVARMRVGYDASRLSPSEIADAIGAAGYVAEPVAAAEESAFPAAGLWRRYRHEISTMAAGTLIVLAWTLGRLPVTWAATASAAAYGLAVVAGGWLTAVRAVASLRTRSLDMNVLMTVAVSGAVAIGQWSEAATVVFLFAFGGLLEARALERTRRSIRDLMRLAPARARVRREGAEVEIAPEDAVIGDLLLVRPGERVALDGDVVRGASAVDESPITGESVPADKAVGDRVYAGSLNTSGLLEVRVESLAGDSTLARVIYLVEEAQSQRAPSQRLVDRFTRYYTPTVVGLAVAVATVPPLLGLGAFDEWLYRALVLLVISCPCALVISTPVAIVSAITRATRDGVLVKGGAFLEAAAKVRAVAFDKTGTLTLGRPAVTDVVRLDDASQDEVLGLAAALEAGSTHPLAEAVVRAAGAGGPLAALSEYRDVPGGGVSGVLGGRRYALGTPAFVEAGGARLDGAVVRVEELEAGGKSVLVLANDTSAIALIGVADEVRPESAETVARLRAEGVSEVVMLTGDNERTAQAVAERAGVSAVRAKLLPAGKVDAVRELRARYGTVAMVGDGINDAPALAAADVGVAMGAVGSDTALETADVALMADDLRPLPGLLRLGRATVAIITQNVVFSVGVKVIFLVLAVLGRATLWMAVFADTGVALLVILNGLRLLRARPA